MKILLVDDLECWRNSVASLLGRNPAWQVIGEASDGLEAIQKAEELRPDLIVLDISLPRLNGIEAARSIRKVAPESKILFFSLISSSEIAAAALSAGGDGYLVKTDCVGQLRLAVDAVLQGKQFVSSALKGCISPTERQSFNKV